MQVKHFGEIENFVFSLSDIFLYQIFQSDSCKRKFLIFPQKRNEFIIMAIISFQNDFLNIVICRLTRLITKTMATFNSNALFMRNNKNTQKRNKP